MKPSWETRRILSPALHVSVGGKSYTFFGTGVLPVSQTVPAQAAYFQTEFIGANSNCTFRAESQLAGFRNYYAGPGLAKRQESVRRFSRAVFQNVWPGVDVVYEIDGWRARIIYSLESDEQPNAIRVRLPNLSPAPVPHTDVRNFGPNLRASIRAVEIMPFGTRPIPVVEIAPGTVLKIAVRGVRSGSAFVPALPEGQGPPTNIRGWSIRFNDIPAPILRLDYDSVTVIVPKNLTGDSVRMKSWCSGRQDASARVRLAAQASS